MTSVELPGANPAVITNGLKSKDTDHKETQVAVNGNGHSKTNGHSSITGNDHLDYTSGIVKEALAYSGRGRPLRV